MHERIFRSYVASSKILTILFFNSTNFSRMSTTITWVNIFWFLTQDVTVQEIHGTLGTRKSFLYPWDLDKFPSNTHFVILRKCYVSSWLLISRVFTLWQAFCWLILLHFKDKLILLEILSPILGKDLPTSSWLIKVNSQQAQDTLLWGIHIFTSQRKNFPSHYTIKGQYIRLNHMVLPIFDHLWIIKTAISYGMTLYD